MSDWLPLTLIAASFLGVAILVVRAAAAERRSRREILADCAALLEDPSIEADAAGYGVLRGRRDGAEVALRPFADTLAFRRLPQLWLAATVSRPTQGAPTMEVLRRPGGTEFHSVGESLPAAFPPPPNWPEDTRVRGSRDAGPLLARLAPALAAGLSDPRTKSVYVSAKGVRVVRQIAQGSRGSYLLFRDSRFSAARAAPADAEAALALALAVSAAAAAAAAGAPPAHEAFDEAAA